MRRISFFAALLLGISLSAPQASADTILEVENARAHARAGYRVSAEDAEFLERWGEHSGSPEWRGTEQSTFEFYFDDRPRKYRRHHHHRNFGRY